MADSRIISRAGRTLFDLPLRKASQSGLLADRIAASMRDAPKTGTEARRRRRQALLLARALKEILPNVIKSTPKKQGTSQASTTTNGGQNKNQGRQRRATILTGGRGLSDDRLGVSRPAAQAVDTLGG